MADPLSVAASVIGLIGAGAKIINVLVQVTKDACDAPDECRRLKDEVETIRNVLSQLQLFVTGQSRPTRSRTSLILVDQVVVTLAACVTTFSDLDVFADNLQSEAKMGILDRLRWSSKEDEIRRILQRVESHKLSLTLMMTILTCQKQDEAEDKVDVLCTLVQKALEQHQFLHHRLTALELHQLGYNAAPGLDTGGDIGVLPDGSTVAQPASQTQIRSFVFEEVLNASRPYRNADRNAGDCFSVISSAGRTGSWSMLSGLSLSEVSHISILAVPIYAGDISNSGAYIFEPADEVGHHGPLQDPDIDKHKPSFSSKSSTSTNLRFDEKSKWSVRLKLRGLIRGPAKRQEISAVVFYVPLGESLNVTSIHLSTTDEDGNKKIRGYIPTVVAFTGKFIKGMLNQNPPFVPNLSAPYLHNALTAFTLTSAREVPDVFVQSGNPRRMMKIQDIFNSPPTYGTGFSWAGFTPYDAAGLMLRYLKSLPEPVIPYQSYSAFLEVGQLYDLSDPTWKEAALEELGRLIAALPSYNRVLLLYLIDMMFVISDPTLGDVGVDRLVAAFQPSILSGQPEVMDGELKRVADDVVGFMVNNVDCWDFETIYQLAELD